MRNRIAAVSAAFAVAFNAMAAFAEEPELESAPSDIEQTIKVNEILPADAFHDGLERIVVENNTNYPFHTVDNVKLREVFDNRERPGQHYLKSHRELFCSFRDNGDTIVNYNGDVTDGTASWSNGSYYNTPFSFSGDVQERRSNVPNKEQGVRMAKDSGSLEDTCHEITALAHKRIRQRQLGSLRSDGPNQ